MPQSCQEEDLDLDAGSLQPSQEGKYSIEAIIEESSSRSVTKKMKMTVECNYRHLQMKKHWMLMSCYYSGFCR